MASILSSSDHYTLIIGALQLVELLLNNASNAYRPSFRREGVLHTVEKIADRKLTSNKAKDKEQEKAREQEAQPTPSAEPGAERNATPSLVVAAPAPAPSSKRSSSTPVDPQDLIILRARVVKFKHLIAQAEAEEDSVMEDLRTLASAVMDHDASETTLKRSAEGIALVLSGSANDISSFELNQSGLISALLSLMTKEDYVGMCSVMTLN